jgi:hypothetical protein
MSVLAMERCRRLAVLSLLSLLEGRRVRTWDDYMRGCGGVLARKYGRRHPQRNKEVVLVKNKPAVDESRSVNEKILKTGVQISQRW